MRKVQSHLNLLHNLFPKRADLCGDADGNVFSSTVLAAHSVENTRALLKVDAQICLN